MLDLDQVESQFRATVRVRPKLVQPPLDRVVLVSDLQASAAQRALERVRPLVRSLSKIRFEAWPADRCRGVTRLIDHLAASPPSLVVAYRHLFEDEVDLPHSLGTYVDMLVQDLPIPVLLLPHPRTLAWNRLPQRLRRVLVVSDHIVGDGRLVCWGARLVELGGVLAVAHVEDDAVFDRYVDAISRIPDIDTQSAKTEIRRRLLSEAEAFIHDVAELLADSNLNLETRSIVRMGHRVQELVSIVEDAGVDLVVANAKDDDQQAMAGRAYALTLELFESLVLLL